jgi:hypothetical protein
LRSTSLPELYQLGSQEGTQHYRPMFSISTDNESTAILNRARKDVTEFEQTVRLRSFRRLNAQTWLPPRPFGNFFEHTMMFSLR